TAAGARGSNPERERGGPMSDPHLPAVPTGPIVQPPVDLPEVLRLIRERTPARILVGPAGPAYPTRTQLAPPHDHAAAPDPGHTEINLARDLGPELVERYRLFEAATCAAEKSEYLMRPDLGRRLNEAARTEVVHQCPPGVDLQVVLGDGLSAAAVVRQ